MSKFGGLLRAYLELVRVSNLPTVLSNVVVGLALGSAQTGIEATGIETAGIVATGIEPATAAASLLAIALIYSGGMALNDVLDAEIDRRERPGRPIPSGRVSQTSAAVLAAAGFALALGLLAWTGPEAALMGLTLIAIVALYNLLHSRNAAAVLLMGAARGMVYLTAAAAAGWVIQPGPVAGLAAMLVAYTVAFSIVARGETYGRPGGWQRVAASAIPLLVLVPVAIASPAHTLLAIAAAMPFVIWTALAARTILKHPPRVGAAVHMWLSGFCLLDVFVLNFLGRPVLSLWALGLFGATWLGHRRIMGT